MADKAADRAREAEWRLEAFARIVLGETNFDRGVWRGSIVAVGLGIILATIGSVGG